MAPTLEQEPSIEFPLSGAEGLVLSARYPVSVTHMVWLGKKIRYSSTGARTNPSRHRAASAPSAAAGQPGLDAVDPDFDADAERRPGHDPQVAHHAVGLGNDTISY